MGTVINGKTVQGMCINGKTVRGACKNGVVFYEKATMSVSLTNLITNGSFESDTMSWSGSTIMNIIASTPGHGELGSAYARITQTTNQNTELYFLQSFTITIPSGQKYYIRCQAQDIGNNINCQLYNNTTPFDPVISKILTANTWELVDGIWTANTTSFRLRIRFNATGGAGTQGSRERTQCLDNVMLLNLTDSFGAGQEPALADIRAAVIAAGGYWDGAKTVLV